jgi:hypothetical protein
VSAVTGLAGTTGTHGVMRCAARNLAHSTRTPSVDVFIRVRWHRAEDGVLLGAHDEVVLGRRWCERPSSPGGEAELVAKPRCVRPVIRCLPSLTASFPVLPSPMHIMPSLMTALFATGVIWVRYSFVITPVNYSLAAVRCVYL